MHNREFKFGYQHFLLCQKSFLKVSSKWLLKNKSDNGKLLLGKTYSGERFRGHFGPLVFFCFRNYVFLSKRWQGIMGHSVRALVYFTTDYEGFLMYSKVTGLESINLHDADNKNHPVTPIKNDTYLRNVIGLTFDYHTQRIFYSDIQRGDIQYVNFKGKNITVVVDGIGSAEGLAFVKGKLYWTSYTNSCISSIDVEEALTNRSKKPDVVIQMSKMDHPRAIVADSCWEYVCFFYSLHYIRRLLHS